MFPLLSSISHENNGCRCQRGKKLHCVLNLYEILQDSRLVFLFLEAKRGLYGSYCVVEKQNNSVLFGYISWALASVWYLQCITASNGLYFKIHCNLKLSEDISLKTFLSSRNRYATFSFSARY